MNFFFFLSVESKIDGIDLQKVKKVGFCGLKVTTKKQFHDRLYMGPSYDEHFENKILLTTKTCWTPWCAHPLYSGFSF